MTLETVTVTWTEQDIGQTPLGGNITFALSGPVSSGGIGIEAQPPRTYFFTSATGTSDPLVANDDPTLQPTGSFYRITVAISGQQPYSFTTPIDIANGASQTLAYLRANAATPGTPSASYLPLPSGTPAAGQMPVVITGGGTATEWLFGSGLALNVRNFGAACDGGASQSGTLNSSAVVTDTTPSAVLPIANQTFTWVGTGSAVGGGISGVTLSASGAAPVITTASAHGLATGAIVTIAGVTGCTEVNAKWNITVLTTTTFSIPLNESALTAAYVSGGTITPQVVLTGFVSSPAINTGTLTFTVVTTSSGSTPITVPAGTASAGTCYYGTDDTTAWTSAITAAEALASPAGPVAVTWAGTSMVSSQLNPVGNVLIQGQWMDYTNPDGTNSGSTLPVRGSILRATGTFTSPSTSAVLKLGSLSGNTTSGQAGTSLMSGVVDAANIVACAVKTASSRNWLLYTYACNGTAQAVSFAGSNSVAIESIAGQSNYGDCLTVTGADCKWKGGYLRQGTNMVHVTAPWSGDFWIGNGAHLFNGYNGGNERSGNDILVDTGGQNIHIGDVILDGVLGPQIRLAPSSGATLAGVLIDGIEAFQPTGTGLLDSHWPVVQIDTSAASSVVSSVAVTSYCALGFSSSRYKSILDCIGSGTQTRIMLGAGVASNCAFIYSTSSGAARPKLISGEIGIFNGGSTVYSSARGSWTTTGNGTSTTFSVAHGLSQTPIDVEIAPSTPATVGCYVTADATNINFTFASAPSNGASLSAFYRAGI